MEREVSHMSDLQFEEELSLAELEQARSFSEGYQLAQRVDSREIEEVIDAAVGNYVQTNFVTVGEVQALERFANWLKVHTAEKIYG